MKWRIIIADTAKFGLKSITSYVAKSSDLKALALRRKILNSIRELAVNPQKYPPDKFQKKIDISVRAFEIEHVRITYLVSVNEITVLRIRHTKRNPLV